MGYGLWEVGPPFNLRACTNYKEAYPKRCTLRSPHLQYPDAHFVFDRLVAMHFPVQKKIPSLSGLKAKCVRPLSLPTHRINLT